MSTSGNIFQGFFILGGDIREFGDNDRLQNDVIWIGHYDEKEHFLLLEDQTLNATVRIGKQVCPSPAVVSGGDHNYGTLNSAYMALIIYYVLKKHNSILQLLTN